jgi:hypothetical protein
MKKVCFVDADDVLLTWIPDFNEHIGQDREYIPQSWGYPELGVEYGTVRNFIQSAPQHDPYPEVVGFVNGLRRTGWEIVVITSHPTNRMMERLDNLNQIGLQYDHVVFTQFFTPDGSTGSVSKAQYIKKAYGHFSCYRLLIDDRLKSVNEFVEMGLGFGASVDRAYNSEDVKRLRENPLLEQRIVLGRGPTMREQLLSMVSQTNDLINAFDAVVVGKVR